MDIDFLLFLQELRETLHPLFGAFFMMVSDLANGPAIIAIPCLIYWCFDKRRGSHVLFSFALGTFVNGLIKVTVCALRPWMRDKRIIPYEDAIESATGYSFPSGHTQSSASILGALGWTYRHEKRWALPLCCILVLLVALSRNMLGVHTPQDVIVGMIVGAIFVIAADALLDWADEKDGRDALLAIASVIITIAACAYVTLKPYPYDTSQHISVENLSEMRLDCYQSSALLMGAFCSWWAERAWLRFEVGCDLRRGILRIVIGIVITVIFRYVLTLPLNWLDLEEAYAFAKGLLTTVAAVYIAPWAFTAFERRGAQKTA